MGNGDNWWSTASNTVWGNVSATYAANSTDYASGYRGDFVNEDAMFITNMREVLLLKDTRPVSPTAALVQTIASGNAAATASIHNRT